MQELLGVLDLRLLIGGQLLATQFTLSMVGTDYAASLGDCGVVDDLDALDGHSDGVGQVSYGVCSDHHAVLPAQLALGGVLQQHDAVL